MFKSEKDICEEILKLRRVTDRETFLNPPRPATFLNKKFYQELFGNYESSLQKIKELITQAIKEKRHIIIYGDYDVDGISSSAILWDLIYNFFSYKNCFPFIPDRFLHGYGISIKGIDEIYKKFKEVRINNKNPLLITTDCGITNVDEIKYAKKLGFETVIIDHHEIPKVIPCAELILHTTSLCAGGICFFLSSFIRETVDEDNLDLAALATICDLQILLGVNRSLVKYGLISLTNAKRVGIKALKEVAGIASKETTPYEVGFILGPRLNAAGRLATAMDSLRLLVTRNSEFALELALKLNELNLERQTHTENIFNEALKEGLNSTEHVLISHNKNYHEGVIGIVAQKLMQKYAKPAIVITEGETVSKASVRSLGEINIIEFLKRTENLFINVGGHKLAAGFSIETKKIEEFKKETYKNAKKYINKEDLKNVVKADLKIPLSFANILLARLLSQFEPFGIGNREPYFESSNIYIYDIKVFGANQKHLNLSLGTKDGVIASAKLFNGMEDYYKKLDIGKKVKIIYTLKINNYRDKEYLDLNIRSLEIET